MMKSSDASAKRASRSASSTTSTARIFRECNAASLEEIHRSASNLPAHTDATYRTCTPGGTRSGVFSAPISIPSRTSTDEQDLPARPRSLYVQLSGQDRKLSGAHRPLAKRVTNRAADGPDHPKGDCTFMSSLCFANAPRGSPTFREGLPLFARPNQRSRGSTATSVSHTCRTPDGSTSGRNVRS